MSRSFQRRLALPKLSLLLGALLCLAIFSEAGPQKISFPGLKSEVISPNGQYRLRNVDDDKQDLAHTLSLTDKRTGSTTKIYSYGRHVDVLWSPSSDALAVNDYEGSNMSHPALLLAPWTDPPIDLREKLIDFLRSRGESKSALENHHVYVSGKQWLNGNELLCEVTGYGDANPKGFTTRYVYKIGQGFRVSSSRAGTAGPGSR